MKVLFLDHDGIICFPPMWGTRFGKQKIFDKYYPDKEGISKKDKYYYPVEERFDNFNAEAIEALNEIIKETNCEIVISSDWKLHCKLNEMQYLYESRGIIKNPIDFTPNYNEEEFKNKGYEIVIPKMSHRDYIYDFKRIMEIKAYLKEHPEITQWVAVDDLLLGQNNWEVGLKNFVYANEFTKGITAPEIKKEIIKFLK